MRLGIFSDCTIFCTAGVVNEMVRGRSLSTHTWVLSTVLLMSFEVLFVFAWLHDSLKAVNLRVYVSRAVVLLRSRAYIVPVLHKKQSVAMLSLTNAALVHALPKSFCLYQDSVQVSWNIATPCM